MRRLQVAIPAAAFDLNGRMAYAELRLKFGSDPGVEPVVDDRLGAD
jgi:hypothetical protein